MIVCMTTTYQPKHAKKYGRLHRPDARPQGRFFSRSEFGDQPISRLHNPSTLLRLAVCRNCGLDLYSQPGERWQHNHNHHDQCVYASFPAADPDPSTVTIGRWVSDRRVSAFGTRAYMMTAEAAYTPKHRGFQPA